jgi:hypothetical protein
MSSLALALMLSSAGTSPAEKATSVQRVTIATVEIVEAEEIRFGKAFDQSQPKGRKIRQNRLRDGMPMVEFY